MVYLEQFNVKEFRGIKELEISGLGNINLIVGDNNSGKTSVLEAIMLLRNTSEFSNVLNVIRLRDNGFYSPFRMSIYDNFLFMFNPEKEEKRIEAEGIINGKLIGISVSGTVENVLVDMTELNERNRRMHDLDEGVGVLLDEKETSEFQGVIESRIDGRVVCEKKIIFNPYTRLSGLKVSKPENVEIVYISPTDHTNGNVFSRIVKNDYYKEAVLRAIQIFDSNIEDILYVKNEQTLRPIECIKHGKLGIMPLSTYGDGIKKVLLLADGIARAAGGILLVDEIETAIHSRYYDDIFKFVINACRQFDIQLFATTHSIEAVDGFLATQYDGQNDEYDSQNENLIRVITFRKNSEKDKTDARVLSGKEVFDNRRNFSFEVRV